MLGNSGSGVWLYTWGHPCPTPALPPGLPRRGRLEARLIAELVASQRHRLHMKMGAVRDCDRVGGRASVGGPTDLAPCSFQESAFKDLPSPQKIFALNRVPHGPSLTNSTSLPSSI